MKTRLLLGNNTPVKVWLNGKLLGTVPAGGKEAVPDQNALEIALVSGVNRLVFGVSWKEASPVFYGRLLDPDRKLTVPEVKP